MIALYIITGLLLGIILNQIREDWFAHYYVEKETGCVFEFICKSSIYKDSKIFYILRSTKNGGYYAISKEYLTLHFKKKDVKLERN